MVRNKNDLFSFDYGLIVNESFFCGHNFEFGGGVIPFGWSKNTGPITDDSFDMDRGVFKVVSPFGRFSSGFETVRHFADQVGHRFLLVKEFSELSEDSGALEVFYLNLLYLLQNCSNFIGRCVCVKSISISGYRIGQYRAGFKNGFTVLGGSLAQACSLAQTEILESIRTESFCNFAHLYIINIST